VQLDALDTSNQSAGEDELDAAEQDGEVVASSTDASVEAEASEAARSSRFARRRAPLRRQTAVDDDSPPAFDTPITMHLPTDASDSQVTY